MGLCSPDIPSAPDPAQGYISSMMADLENFPFVRQIEAASVNGEKVVIDGVTYDFTGTGEADYQEKYIDQMAKAALEAQKKYGPDFIKQRLAELNAADPEGVAARTDMFSRIMARADSAAPGVGDSQAIQDRILADLQRGATLDEPTKLKVQNVIRGNQVAIGNDRGPAAAAAEARGLTAAGEDQRNRGYQQAMDFLTSGQTPEDLEYQWGQQNQANLGAFLSGETPAAQFSQVSGAANGAVPFNAYSGSGTNPNSGNAGMAWNLDLYRINNAYNANQIDPVIAGLGFGIQGAGVNWGAIFGGGGGGAPAGTVTTPWASSNYG